MTLNIHQISGHSDGWSADTTHIDLLSQISTEDYCASMRTTNYVSTSRDGLKKRLTAGWENTWLLKKTFHNLSCLNPSAKNAWCITLYHNKRSLSQAKMYQTLCKEYYWSAMDLDAYVTIRNCMVCAKERVRERKRSTTLKIFTASGPLEDVSMDLERVGRYSARKEGQGGTSNCTILNSSIRYRPSVYTRLVVRLCTSSDGIYR